MQIEATRCLQRGPPGGFMLGKCLVSARAVVARASLERLELGREQPFSPRANERQLSRFCIHLRTFR